MVNPGLLLERIRERLVEEADHTTLCGNCLATLTEADRAAGECTQCHSSVESDDEDLQDHDEFEFDWYNADGMLDEQGD